MLESWPKEPGAWSLRGWTETGGKAGRRVREHPLFLPSPPRVVFRLGIQSGENTLRELGPDAIGDFQCSAT